MTEFPRLRDQSQNPLISEMLSAAGREAPRPRAMRSTLIAAATAASVIGGQATAGAAVGGAAAASLAKLAVKWTLLSVVVVGGGVAGVESSGILSNRGATSASVSSASAHVERARPPVPARGHAQEQGDLQGQGDLQEKGAPAHLRAVAAFPEAAVPERPSNAALSNPAPNPRARQSTQVPRALGPDRARLEREVALLDEARRALGQARYADAQRLSERYLAEYPRGTLEQEARYLRMQAARSQGDRVNAQAEARALLELNPSGPHAKAARELYAPGE